MRCKTVTMILAIAPLAAAYAQTSKMQALLQAMGANAKQMSAYQWKQKTTIMRAGNPAGFKLEEVRFDAAGQPQRTTLSQPEQKRMGPLRARKAAAVRDDVQEVMQLAARYAHPQLQAQAVRSGEIWEGPGTLRVRARALISPLDEVEISISSTNHLVIRADVKTQHDGRPVNIALEYQPIPNGPSMLARMTVQIPADNIVVNVESFDYVRLASPNFP